LKNRDKLNLSTKIIHPLLFSPPFSDISPNGLIAVFNEQKSAEIVSLLDRVNRNAVVV